MKPSHQSSSGTHNIDAYSSLHINLTMAAQQRQLKQRPINLLRGWPASSLLPAHLISAAAQRSLANPDIYVPALEYGPDAGYQPLREALAEWLADHYRTNLADPERICITGGASQSLASLLQSYTDPSVTRAIWLVAPVFHLVCPTLEDAGFAGRLKAVPEDEDGLDVALLERKLKALEEKETKDGFKPTVIIPSYILEYYFLVLMKLMVVIYVPAFQSSRP